VRGAGLGTPAAPSARLPCQGILCPGVPSTRNSVPRGGVKGFSAGVLGSQGAALALWVPLDESVARVLGRETARAQAWGRGRPGGHSASW
jgi:hypothetical protein